MKLSTFGYKLIAGTIEVVASVLTAAAVALGFVFYVFPFVGRITGGSDGWYATDLSWWGHGLKGAVLLLAIVASFATAIVVAALVQHYLSRDDAEPDRSDPSDATRSVYVFTALVLLVATVVMGAGATAYFDSPDDECTVSVHYSNGTLEELKTVNEPCETASLEVLYGSNETGDETTEETHA